MVIVLADCCPEHGARAIAPSAEYVEVIQEFLPVVRRAPKYAEVVIWSRVRLSAGPVIAKCCTNDIQRFSEGRRISFTLVLGIQPGFQHEGRAQCKRVHTQRIIE